MLNRLTTAQVWVHDQDEALAFYTEKLGMELRESGTADYAKFMQDDIERYRTAMKTFKIQIN